MQLGHFVQIWLNPHFDKNNASLKLSWDNFGPLGFWFDTCALRQLFPHQGVMGSLVGNTWTAPSRSSEKVMWIAVWCWNIVIYRDPASQPLSPRVAFQTLNSAWSWAQLYCCCSKRHTSPSSCHRGNISPKTSLWRKGLNSPTASHLPATPSTLHLTLSPLPACGGTVWNAKHNAELM